MMTMPRRDAQPQSTATGAPAATATATDGGSSGSGTAVPTVAGGQTASDSPTTAQGDDDGVVAGQSSEQSLVLTPVVSLPDPIALVARPGTGSDRGDLYVASRGGQVWLITADGDEPPRGGAGHRRPDGGRLRRRAAEHRLFPPMGRSSTSATPTGKATARSWSTP